MSIAWDMVEVIRGTKRAFFIDDNISFNTIADKYEDYIAGIELTLTITTTSDYDGCDFPI